MRYLTRHLPAGTARVVEELVEAADEAEAQRMLVARGSVVLAVQARSSMQTVGGARGFDVAWWCRELEALLRAGMTAVEAIETLAVTSSGVRKAVHERLLRALHEGASLSRAMRLTGAFPDVLSAGVTASERTGALADALRDYLRYDDMLQKLRRQALSAAMYPAIVVSLGTVIALFLLLYVIPRFSRMYGGFRGELSLPTALVMGLSDALRHNTGLIVTALALGVGVLVLLVQRGRLQPLAEAALEALPWLRARVDDFRLAKMYQSLALLFKGGYTFDEAMGVCAGLSLGPRMSAALDSARRAVASGKSASYALAGAGLSDLTAQRLLAVGERTGDFAGVLQTIAERHAQAFATFVERATRLVEPVLLLAVALVVGGLVVLMYLPIFDLAGGLGGPP
jgi:general secretion pathway protein F